MPCAFRSITGFEPNTAQDPKHLFIQGTSTNPLKEPQPGANHILGTLAISNIDHGTHRL